MPTIGWSNDAVTWKTKVSSPIWPKFRLNFVFSVGYIAGNRDCIVSFRKWEKLIASRTAKTTPSGAKAGLVSTLVLLLMIIPYSILSRAGLHSIPERWPRIPLYPYL